MTDQSHNQQRAALFRKLQWITPLILGIAAVAFYFYLNDHMKVLGAVGLLLFGVMDFFVFKMMADKIERGEL